MCGSNNSFPFSPGVRRVQGNTSVATRMGYYSGIIFCWRRTTPRHGSHPQRESGVRTAYAWTTSKDMKLWIKRGTAACLWQRRACIARMSTTSVNSSSYDIVVKCMEDQYNPQLEKGGLALVFGVTSFVIIFFDNRCTLVTDHKPLNGLFHQN